MPQWLDVDSRSGVPIYRQLIQQIQHALEIGALQPGEQLPTVRQLASELTIAPNTIVKAYEELARQGLIESKAGVGTIVLLNIEGRLHQQQQAALFERLHLLVRDAAHLGIPQEQVQAEFETALRRFYHGDEQQAEEGAK